MTAPLDRQLHTLAKTGMTRFFRRMFDDYPDLLDEGRDGREDRARTARCSSGGSGSATSAPTASSGSISIPRLWRRWRAASSDWGTHNGTSRAFSSIGPNVEAEAKIAAWLGTEAALIYPSVTLANVGALPGLATRHDVIVADQHAHNSIEEGMRIAKARGVRTAKFEHNDPADLERLLASLRPYRHAVVALDGVYSMSGHLPPLAEFQRVARGNDGFLYVDDAHGTGVLGTHGPRHRTRCPRRLREHARGRVALEGRVVPGRLRGRFEARRSTF